MSARLVLLYIFSFPILSGIAAQAATAPVPVLWQEPGAISEKNFTYGPGGRDNVPAPPFRFVEEDLGGTSPKVKARDARGRLWVVKFGPEVKSDTFAPRLAWALGYFVAPVYYVPRGRILGAAKLRRADAHIAGDGRFNSARFKLIDQRLKYVRGDGWRWRRNPFLGTRELSGLRMLMMLTSNWDAKDARDAESNTAVYRNISRGRTFHIYGFDDWGSSMGKWGNYFTREKWDCEAFREQSSEFVRGVKYGNVGWGYGGKHQNDITDDIPLEQVRWFVRYLSKISDAQIRAGLAASGANRHEIQCFTQALRSRINQMKRVAQSRRTAAVISRRFR